MNSTPYLRRLTYSAVVCIALAGVGCQSTAKQLASSAGEAAAQAAVPGVVKGLDALQQPENQQRVQRLAHSPAVQDASQSVGEGLGRGIADEMVAIATGLPRGIVESANAPTTQSAETAQTAAAVFPARRATVDESRAASDTAAASARAQVPVFVRDTVNPAISSILNNTVRQLVAEIRQPDSREGVDALAQTIGAGMLHGIPQEAERNTAPALQRIIRDQLGPAIGDAMSRALREQLTPTVRDLVHQELIPAVSANGDLLEKHLTPAVRSLLNDTATNALKIPVRPEVAPDVVQNARNLSIGATLGTHDAMIQLGMLKPDGQWNTQLKVFVWTAGGVALRVGLCSMMLLVVLTMLALSLRRGRLAITKPAAG